MGVDESISYHWLVGLQRAFFHSNVTYDLDFRVEQLKKLRDILKSNEKLLDKAIYADFKKSSFENYATELSLLYHEINLCVDNIHTWGSRSRVSTNWTNLPGSSYLIPEPLGVSLIIGAWNYPFLLSLHPAISAIAAGNTVIVKPSELSLNTSRVMADLINTHFDENYFHVVEGGVEETTALLKEKFDKIFYTGSARVGKLVMHAAAEHLTPVTLELGGKSPAFVFNDAKIKVTAKRIVWSKFLNSGQTCVAPDYLLVEKGIKDRLISEIMCQIREIYGENPADSEAFVQIINQRHFKRIVKLIDPDKVVMGGDFDIERRYIAPTLMDNVGFDDAVMQEEIFGPVLPIIEFDDLSKIIRKLKNRPKPLALYVFTSSSKTRDQILKELPFGGGAINDAVMHLANSNLPFGGVGSSGMGTYHGKYGFDTFTHYKAVLEKSTWVEPSIKYPPYSGWKLAILKRLLE